MSSPFPGGDKIPRTPFPDRGQDGVFTQHLESPTKQAAAAQHDDDELLKSPHSLGDFLEQARLQSKHRPAGSRPPASPHFERGRDGLLHQTNKPQEIPSLATRGGESDMTRRKFTVKGEGIFSGMQYIDEPRTDIRRLRKPNVWREPFFWLFGVVSGFIFFKLMKWLDWA